MAEHPNATALRKAISAMNEGEMAAVQNFIADDVEWHEIGLAEPIRGKAALAERYAGGGAPDFTITTSLHDVVANDEHALAMVNADATRNGKKLHYRTVEICHMKDGKITARWAFSDDTAAINDFFA
jgi:uncharacterized protein